ncbi:MAG: flavin-containing monooxygenase [Gammaproteobacteria bacterium]
MVVGAGQGGLSVSYWLRGLDIEHVVLERSSIAASWRDNRWNSFCTVTPNWTIKLPGAEYAGDDPDGFMLRDELVRYFETWAHSFHCPIRCGIEVTGVRARGDAFELDTGNGRYSARNVVIATSNYQSVNIPSLATRLPGRVRQLTSHDYKSPATPAPGAVLVVGSGQTGCQIAEELNAAGRSTYHCVGRAGRLPRRYRGRDCLEWQRDMGYLERTPDMLDDPADRFRGDPHLSGKDGGRTLSLHDFHRDGITLLGRLAGCEGERLLLDADLHEQMRFSDEFCADILAKFDRHIASNGIDAPLPTATELAGGPPANGALPDIVRELDLARAGINTVIWATGYRFDFSWIELPVLDASGYPDTTDGVSAHPGLCFVGLNWMTRRKSGILYGVGDDARRVSEHIAARVDGGAAADRCASARGRAAAGQP